MACVQLSAFTAVVLRVNGKTHKWERAVDKGFTLDRLPEQLQVIVEATSPAGARLGTRFRLPVAEPPIAKP